MDAFQPQFSNGMPDITGRSSLSSTLQPYVTQNSLEFQLQDFAQDVQTGQFSLPTFSAFSQDKKADGPIDANNQRINNLSTLDISSIAAILATPNSAVNVSTMTSYNTFNVPTQIASLTNTILPFTTTTSMKDRTIINAGDPRPYTDQSTPAEIQERIKDVVTVGYLNVNTLRRNIDGEYYDANNSKIKNLSDAELYLDNQTTDAVADPLEPDQFNNVLNQERLTGFKQQAINLGILQQATVSLNTANRNAFNSQAKQIKNGMQATEAKDYVTLDQVIAQEVAQLQFELIPGIKVGDGPLNHVKLGGNKVYTVRDPLGPPDNTNLDKMRVVSSDPAVFQALDGQIANMKQVNKKLDKNANIDMKSEHRVVNLIQPEASHHAVNKAYCDSNSSKNQSDGTGAITGLLGGALGGAISGALVSTLGQGLTAIGGITTPLTAGGAALGTGLLIGNAADFARAGIPAGDQLIDNLKDDIANGGQQPPDPDADGGALMNGALSVSGLLSAARNSVIGLFDLLP